MFRYTQMVVITEMSDGTENEIEKNVDHFHDSEDAGPDNEDAGPDNEDAGPDTDEMLTDGSGGEPNLDDEGEELDFTKPTPKDCLPDKMKGFRPPKVKSKEVNFEECDGCCEESSDYEEENRNCEDSNEDNHEASPRTRKKRKNSEATNVTNQRVIAFIVIFPMLVTGVYMLYEMLGRFQFGKSVQQLSATVGGAVVALVVMSQVAILRSAIKFVLCFAWIVFCVPTYQVYTCSPIELKNDMLGTWFKLKTTAGKFLEDSYATSECFKSSRFPTPYTLSVMSPKITLKVDISELINLNMESETAEVESAQSMSYFLLISKRSVKKKFHKLYLIVEAPNELAEQLKKSLRLSAEEKDQNLIHITGSIYDLDESLEPMKKELQNMNYFVRPIKLKVHHVKYVDRYVKLRSTADEHLY